MILVCLRIHRLSIPFPGTQIRDSGRPNTESIVRELLSDGFEADQKGSWPNPAPGTALYHADNAITTMTNTHPFTLFEDLFTVYLIHTYRTSPMPGVGYLGTIRYNESGIRTVRGTDPANWMRILDLADMVVAPAEQTMIQVISNADQGGG